MTQLLQRMQVNECRFAIDWIWCKSVFYMAPIISVHWTIEKHIECATERVQWRTCAEVAVLTLAAAVFMLAPNWDRSSDAPPLAATYWSERTTRNGGGTFAWKLTHVRYVMTGSTDYRAESAVETWVSAYELIGGRRDAYWRCLPHASSVAAVLCNNRPLSQ